MSDAGVLLVAEIHGRTGLAEDLLALLEELGRATRAEPECRSYRVLRDEGPGEFVLLGAWRSEAALRIHYETDHYRRYRDQVGPFLSRASDVVVHQVSGTVHALDPDPPDPGLFG